MSFEIPAPRPADATFCGFTDMKYPPVGAVGCENSVFCGCDEYSGSLLYVVPPNPD